jgi:ABC-2 type transport system permease protein
MGGASVFMTWILWRAIFAGRATVGGLSLSMTLTHYVIAAIVRRLDQSEAYVWEFAAEIRGGFFGKYLVRPVNPLYWFLSICVGRGLFILLPLTAAGLVCAVVLGDALVAPRSLVVLAIIPIVALGLLALALLNFLTSLLAFVFQEITPFHMIKSELVAFLSGSLVPLAMMPSWARNILRWTPFPSLASLPASLWFGAPKSDALAAIAVLFGWNAALFLACSLCLRALSARYEEVGA